MSSCTVPTANTTLSISSRSLVVVHVDGVRPSLNCATNGPTVHPPGDMCITELWWNDIDWEKPKNTGKMSHCYYDHHKSHTGANPGLRGERSATNRLSHGTAYYAYLMNILFSIQTTTRITTCYINMLKLSFNNHIK
jgi:hypothetical protein